ncbi:hypothetical protein V8E51_005566 [Hyaloscypha variabilis]
MREREKCVILLRSQPNQFEGRHEKLKAYVEKMLHFMIHAFLELWTCERVACRKGFEKLGKTGDGRAWQDVAVAVENAGERTGVGATVVASDEDVRKQDLERWGMAREDVENAVEEATETGRRRGRQQNS